MNDFNIRQRRWNNVLGELKSNIEYGYTNQFVCLNYAYICFTENSIESLSECIRKTERLISFQDCTIVLTFVNDRFFI